MRKIIILTVMLLLLCGCSKNEYTPPSVEVVKYPNDNSSVFIYSNSSTVESTENNNVSNNEPITYYANINSKKFHLPECAFAMKISEENVYLESDYEALISYGYEPCKVCNP